VFQGEQWPIIVAGASGAFCHLGHIGANKPGGPLIAHSGSAPNGWSINKTQVPSDLSMHLHAVIMHFGRTPTAPMFTLSAAVFDQTQMG
jgi:hypothetical protein